MRRILIGLPAPPGVGDRGLVPPIEHFKAAAVICNLGRFGTIGQHQNIGTVRVFLVRRNPHRLQRRVAIQRSAMRHERILIERPERAVQRLGALCRPGPDHGTRTAFQDLFDQLRQRALKRRVQQMIKADLGHRRLLNCGLLNYGRLSPRNDPRRGGPAAGRQTPCRPLALSGHPCSTRSRR